MSGVKISSLLSESSGHLDLVRLREGGLYVVEARNLEHNCPHTLKVRFIGSISHPKSMFQLSGIHCNSSWTLKP